MPHPPRLRLIEGDLGQTSPPPDHGLALPIGPEFLNAVAERVAELLGPDTDPEPEAWIGVAEAAAHIAAPRSRIYDLVHQRRVPFRKEGSRLLFKRSWLNSWLEAETA